MGLVPYNFEPEYSVEQIHSPRFQQKLKQRTATLFQNRNSPSKISYTFLLF